MYYNRTEQADRQRRHQALFITLVFQLALLAALIFAGEIDYKSLLSKEEPAPRHATAEVVKP